MEGLFEPVESLVEGALIMHESSVEVRADCHPSYAIFCEGAEVFEALCGRPAAIVDPRYEVIVEIYETVSTGLQLPLSPSAPDRLFWGMMTA